MPGRENQGSRAENLFPEKSIIPAMTDHAALQEFLSALQESLLGKQFIKLSLGNYKGAEKDLRQLHARVILVKREEKLSLTYRYATRDIVKNYPFGEALLIVRQFLENGFGSATLFTAEYDLKLEKGALRKSAATQQPASLEHDRKKQRLIGTEGKHYLHALKITDANGTVLKAAQDKYRQINKYIEILDGLLRSVPPQPMLKIADMGSGKGYLTFALYDHVTATLGLKAEITGVEYRQDMVDLCNAIARDSGFDGLRFVQGTIAQHDSSGTQVLIALHACDTATDEAIAKGIQAGAEVIVVAPCCHKQIRRQMEKHTPPAPFDALLKHGIFLEREAEMVTDGLRGQILEYSGYSTKIFEFISDAHTPKNVMIVATKGSAAKPALRKKIQETKDYFGITHHHLEHLLGLE